MRIDTTLQITIDLEADERFDAPDFSDQMRINYGMKMDFVQMIQVDRIKVDLLADDSSRQVHAEGARVRKDGKGTKGAAWHMAWLTEEQEAHFLKLAREHWATVQVPS
jgi:hypothetical protein